MTDWDTVQTVMVTADQDADAADDTVTLTHTASGTTAYSGVTGEVVVTIDDDDLPVASFAMASFTTNEGSGTYNVVVNLSPAPTANTTISYTVDVASTATPGTDYTTLTGTVVASASASSVEIPVIITDDSTQEGSETVILTLTAGSGYTVGTDRMHTLTIADNEAAPVGTPVASFAVASFTTKRRLGHVQRGSQSKSGADREHHDQLHGGRHQHGDTRYRLHHADRHGRGVCERVQRRDSRDHHR